MILVDTTVLIDLLKGVENEKTEIFEEIQLQNIPYGITSYTYQEVLQGARDEAEYKKLKKYLSSQTIYFLPEIIETYDKAANIFFSLRKQGVTIRSTIDILIGLTAIEHDLLLLHNDKDFDAMAVKIKDLKIFNHF